MLQSAGSECLLLSVSLPHDQHTSLHAADTKSMAVRLSQLKVEMERERAERERNRTTTYLWSTSASPAGGTLPTKKRGGPGSQAYTQSSAYRHSIASMHSWQPPELQHNFVNIQAGATMCMKHPDIMRPSSDVSAACESSLLDGVYDEYKASRDFREALQAWRGPTTAAACTPTTSTAISTGTTKVELLVKEQKPCTLFHRLATGHRSQEASLQAAQNCVCENAGGDAAKETSETDDTLQAGNTQADPSTPPPEPSKLQAELVSSSPALNAVQSPEESLPEQDEDAENEEDASPDNVLSISNLQLSQALPSKIRLPDSVHVPCSHDPSSC